MFLKFLLFSTEICDFASPKQRVLGTPEVVKVPCLLCILLKTTHWFHAVAGAHPTPSCSLLFSVNFSVIFCCLSLYFHASDITSLGRPGTRMTRCNYFLLIERLSIIMPPLSSDRQHLSYDVCLEVEGRLSELFCDVLCTTAGHSHKHTYEQFLQFSGLGFVTLGPFHFTVHRFICVYLCVFLFYTAQLYYCEHDGWTWWDGSLILRTYLPLVLWHCWLGHLTHKTPSLIWPIICLVGR